MTGRAIHGEMRLSGKIMFRPMDGIRFLEVTHGDQEESCSCGSDSNGYPEGTGSIFVLLERKREGRKPARLEAIRALARFYEI